MGEVEVLGAPALPPQARDDEMLLQLWLHGRPGGTRSAYERDVGAFLALAASRCGR